MDQNQAWQYFEKTGSVEAYLLYQALNQKENQKGYDMQSQGHSSSDRQDCK